MFDSGVPKNKLELYIVFSGLEFILSLLGGQNHLLPLLSTLMKNQLPSSVSIMHPQKDICLTVINVMSNTLV